MFSELERAYLRSQRLARIATVSPTVQPDVAPVAYEFDGTHLYVGGLSMTRTLKYRNARANPRVAIVVDDAGEGPRAPRGVKVHGTATLEEREGPRGPRPVLKITPAAHWSWGIESPTFREGTPVINKTTWPRGS
jgi:pyridoxamine 5'-phosphate oxidase family protein